MESRIHLIDLLQTLVKLQTITQDIADKILSFSDKMVEEEKWKKDTEVKVESEMVGKYHITCTEPTLFSDVTYVPIYAFD